MMSSNGESGASGASLYGRARLFMVLAALLWSLAGVFIKSLDLPPVTIVFYRSLFAALFFLPFLRRFSLKPRGPLLLSVTSYTAAVSSFVWANKLTTAANAIVLQYTAPLFVYLFIRFAEGKPIARENLLTLLSGMLGIVVIFNGSRAGHDLAGVAVAVTSGFLFAVYMVNLGFLKGFNPLMLNLLNNFTCAAALLPLLGSGPSLTMEQGVLLALMGIVQLGIPYLLFSKGLENLSLAEGSLIVLIEPVLNPIWVAWVVGETPSTATLIGGGLILLSLGLRYFLRGASKEPPVP